MADPSITRSTRTYILATLFATLAATALIAMFVAILCPAQVTFMVTRASRSNSSDNSMVSLHLSISANTSQRRTKVKFESIFVDLFNSSYRPQGREDAWRGRINARVDDMPHDYLKYPGYTSITVSAPTSNRTFLAFADDNDYLIDKYGVTVKVMAQVHFKVGVVRTRLYGITVYCDGVVFPAGDQHSNKTICASPTFARPNITARPGCDWANETIAFPVTCHS